MAFPARLSPTVVRTWLPNGARLFFQTQKSFPPVTQHFWIERHAQAGLRNASEQTRSITYAQKAKELNQQGINDQMSEYNRAIADDKDGLTKAPWHREGADTPPVERQRPTGTVMKKGTLLTTPSRLLKLVLPLTTLHQNSDLKDTAPLALLVHPQQPLSYLERLIQSELPTIRNEKGENRVPAVSFKAMEAKGDEAKPSEKKTAEELEQEEASVHEQRGEHVDSYGSAGREGKGKDDGDFVRWSASTEIGDFIRDAARAKEFEVEIEGAQESIKIGVPSFNDRTFYLRQRLRKTARRLAKMARVKEECDQAAHRGGQRIAMGGCGILVAYWYIIYRFTFETDLGWETMEPVTYLVGLSTLIGGYMWFLYHNREVSYKAALNITISRRQSKLYGLKGFDLPTWEGLIEEGNAIRKEIKAVASEYDVEWDERKDEQDEVVVKALRDDRKASKNGSKSKDDSDDDSADDGEDDKK